MWCHIQVKQYFYVRHVCLRGIAWCAKMTHHYLMGKKMAIRKKTETIHLRVKPTTKAYLESLANATGKTSTQILEDLLEDAAAGFVISDAGDYINRASLKNNKLDMKTALDAALVDHDAILTKLRTFYLAKEALSLKDRYIISAIIESRDMFLGKDEIFSEDDEIIKSYFIAETPKLSTQAILQRKSSLEDYGDFREKNPNLKSTYKEYLKMSGEE